MKIFHQMKIGLSMRFRYYHPLTSIVLTVIRYSSIKTSFITISGPFRSSDSNLNSSCPIITTLHRYLRNFQREFLRFIAVFILVLGFSLSFVSFLGQKKLCGLVSSVHFSFIAFPQLGNSFIFIVFR